MLGVPCTGSDPVAIGMTLDKALAKLMAKAHGIVTAPWEVVAPTLMSARAGKSAGATLRYPLFVKPSCEGSSMGVTAKSLCRNEAELHEAVARVGAYGPALIEEYLTGDEYTVGIVGGEVIAVMQVVPKMKEENFFYSIEVKRDYKNRVEYRIVDAPEVGAVALAIWRAFGLRDVARIDVRCERDGEEEVLDCASESAEILGAEMVPVRHNVDAALQRLREFDIVVDFCEGVLGNPQFEKSFALALEMIGVAHTSCDPIAVALCTDKILVKRLLQAAGLPTPRGYASPRDAPLPGTYIVKPALEDAGIGIDCHAVVSSRADLEARCAYV